MKKIFFVFAAVAVLFAACSKENPSNDNSIIPEESSVKVYTLSATMPQTKATVNTDEGVNKGQFLWESTDQIAVYDNEQNVYQVFTATGSGANVTFTFTATDGKDHDFTSSTAYYPASRVVGTTVSTYGKINSVGDVPMTATNNGGNLEFDYEAAVVKLTVNHVPSFANTVLFQNNGKNYTASFSHSANETMTFYFAVEASESASSRIIVSASSNEIINKSFELTGAPVNGALIPLKTTIGYPILVKNETTWDGLDIYCYSATDTWKNADWGQSLATVKTITIGSTTYSYILAKGTDDSYSFVFRKPNSDYPRVEHKGIAVSGETKVVLNTTNGARVEGNETPRLIVYNQNKQGPVYIHYWGNGITGTTWSSYTDASRLMISKSGDNMEMSSKCTGLIYTGNNVSGGDWYFYYDFADFASTVSSFNFRLHQSENMGSEFANVTVETNMYYGWWNNNNGGSWGAGAWKL